jgi:hypothetical protein
MNKLMSIGNEQVIDIAECIRFVSSAEWRRSSCSAYWHFGSGRPVN